MEEHLTVPTIEQLTVCLLSEVLEAVGLVQAREGAEGLPAARRAGRSAELRGAAGRHPGPARRGVRGAGGRIDEAKRGAGAPLLITLAVAQRIFPERSHKALEEALQIVKKRHHHGQRPLARCDGSGCWCRTSSHGARDRAARRRAHGQREPAPRRQRREEVRRAAACR